MKCDVCRSHCWENFQIRRHPDNPTPYTNWHIHYCQRCAYIHDYRELARINAT